jgi:chromosome segregation ATPase
VKAKHPAQDLRQVLQERLVELQRTKSEWLSRETALHDDCEKLVSQLRDVDTQSSSDRNFAQSQHTAQLAQLKQRHQLAVRELESQIEDALAATEDDSDERLDAEIASLKNELTALEDGSQAAEDIETVDPDAEERQQQLEDRLEEVRQRHDDVLRSREEDSRKATEMLSQLVEKQEQEEAAHQEAVRARIEQLNAMDREQSERLESSGREAAAEKKRIVASIKSAAAKIAQMRDTVAKRQRDYERTIGELQGKADQLRAALEARTIRQQEQMKEAVACAKKFGEEKRRFVGMHRELEMLNAERVREAVEHATLMKEVSKMDGYVLSQLSAGAGLRSTAGKSTKF